MPLSSGERLGPYEVIGPIGHGGMGEVHRARDTRLARDVAIKLSSERFTDRFESEARAIAALNHPNICTLHDVGPNYLVMELVEGPTLADRIDRGRIPHDEALAIAVQIADALEAAHAKGITHRDLKPGNVKIRPDGTVKVLDFGLAKLGLTDGENTANSPTTIVPATGAGAILGTAGYMAPEQAKGKAVDKRADIWAFGVVVWEMLTGRRLFDGDSTSEILAAVLTKEPTWDGIPPRFEFVLRRCLEKDPKRRWHDIRDARLLLEDAPIQDRPARNTRRAWLPWVVAGTLAVALAVTLWRSRPPAAPNAPLSQFVILPPRGTQFTNVSSGAVSPDGRFVAFTAAGPTSDDVLWVRPLDSLDARLVPGTENGSMPAWSPDSKSIIFHVTGGTLKRVDIAGGAPQIVATSTGSSLAGGIAWGPDGSVLFGTANGLFQVSASGGTRRTLTEPDPARQEQGLGFPQFLPDGRFLYSIQSSNADTAGLYIGSLDRPGDRVRILRTHDPAIYAPPQAGWPGYLVFLRDQTLMAQRFDPATLRLEGDPMRIADGLSPSNFSRMAFSVSSAGPLVYRTGGVDSDRRLTWINRDGTREDGTAPGLYQSFRLSPDDREVALDASNGVEDIWRLEFARGVRTRLTSGDRREVVPVWSPDGRYLAFMSNRTGVFQLYRKDARGGGPEEVLTTGANTKYVTDWGRNGYLLYYEAAPDTKDDLWALPMDGGGKPVLVLQTAANEHNGAFSPDGKWIAYASDESGREEVYIQPFPPTGFKWTVSNQGGNRPRWRRDQKELFYLSAGRAGVMTAEVQIDGANIRTGAPRQLFPLPWPLPVLVSPYDVTADGQRFLVLEPDSASTGSAVLTVMLNWQAGLKP